MIKSRGRCVILCRHLKVCQFSEYNEHDVLGVPVEHVIGQSSTCDESVERIGLTSGLWVPGDADSGLRICVVAGGGATE